MHRTFEFNPSPHVSFAQLHVQYEGSASEHDTYGNSKFADRTLGSFLKKRLRSIDNLKVLLNNRLRFVACLTGIDKSFELHMETRLQQQMFKLQRLPRKRQTKEQSQGQTKERNSKGSCRMVASNTEQCKGAEEEVAKILRLPVVLTWSSMC
eukprot:5335622-Amphidinium_carterae.1